MQRLSSGIIHFVEVKGTEINKKLIRRSECERELSTATSSATFTQFAPEAIEFGEIRQNKLRYTVEGHSRSPILVPVETHIYDFLLVINTNLPPILYRFRDRPIGFDRSIIAIFGYPSCVQPPGRRGSLYHIIVSNIAKTRCFGLHFCRRKFRYIFNHFYAVRPGSHRIR